MTQLACVRLLDATTGRSLLSLTKQNMKYIAILVLTALIQIRYAVRENRRRNIHRYPRPKCNSQDASINTPVYRERNLPYRDIPALS